MPYEFMTIVLEESLEEATSGRAGMPAADSHSHSLVVSTLFGHAQLPDRWRRRALRHPEWWRGQTTAELELSVPTCAADAEHQQRRPVAHGVFGACGSGRRIQTEQRFLGLAWDLAASSLLVGTETKQNRSPFWKLVRFEYPVPVHSPGFAGRLHWAVMAPDGSWQAPKVQPDGSQDSLPSLAGSAKQG